MRSKEATVHADEARHWDSFSAKFPVKRINHSEAFSKDGVCTNQAESYFACLRRMNGGQHHFVSPQHPHAYAVYAAWLEEYRREHNSTLTKRALGLDLAHPVSRE